MPWSSFVILSRKDHKEKKPIKNFVAFKYLKFVVICPWSIGPSWLASFVVISCDRALKSSFCLFRSARMTSSSTEKYIKNNCFYIPVTQLFSSMKRIKNSIKWNWLNNRLVKEKKEARTWIKSIIIDIQNHWWMCEIRDRSHVVRCSQTSSRWPRPKVLNLILQLNFVYIFSSKTQQRYTHASGNKLECVIFFASEDTEKLVNELLIEITNLHVYDGWVFLMWENLLNDFKASEFVFWGENLNKIFILNWLAD